MGGMSRWVCGKWTARYVAGDLHSISGRLAKRRESAKVDMIAVKPRYPVVTADPSPQGRRTWAGRSSGLRHIR